MPQLTMMHGCGAVVGDVRIYRLIDLNLISACVWLCTAQVQRALVQPWDWEAPAPGRQPLHAAAAVVVVVLPACLPARPAAAGADAAQHSASTPGLSVEYTDCISGASRQPAQASARYSTGLVQCSDACVHGLQ